MSCLTTGILIGNIVAWLAFTIIAFVGNIIFGFLVLICFILFLIFYFNSTFFIISKLDKFVSSEWDIFKHKLGWANGQALSILIIAIIIGQVLGVEG